MRKAALFCWLLVLCLPTGCGVYSFSGVNISPEVKTVSIQRFFDDTGAGPPTLSQTFTEKLRDFFQNNTSLVLVDEGGDLQLEGSISRFDLTPVAPQANELENAALNRLTIAVNARFVNNYDEAQNFESAFSFFSDFPAGQSLDARQNELIDEITDQLVLDVFNRSVANW